MKFLRQITRLAGHLSALTLAIAVVVNPVVPAAASAVVVTFPSNAGAFGVGTWQSVATVTSITPAISGGSGGTFRVVVSANNSGLLRLATVSGISASTSYNLSNFNANSNGLGVISFEGSVADVNAAFGSLQFRKNAAGTSLITAEVTEGTGLVFGNSYYVVVTTSGITWANAFAAALTQTVPRQGGGLPCQGYLATITSESEQAFAYDKVRTQSWIGLSDQVDYVNNAIASYNIATNPDLTPYANAAAVEGKFHWVSGPERGVQVTTANAGGSNLVSGVYSNWNNSEPNDHGSGEDATQMLADGKWNDLPHASTTLTTYIVEFGGIRATANHQTNVNNVVISNQDHLGTKEACVPAIVASTVTRSFSAIAANVPGQPNPPSATAGAQQVSLGWTAPGSDGGTSITGYRIDISSDNGSTYTTAIANTGSALTTAVISNLSAGTSYLFKVFAINAIGTGTGSNASTAVTVLAGAPGIPLNVQVSYPSSSLVQISWDPPASDGGSAITNYLVEYQNGGTWIALTPTGRTASTSAVNINDGWLLRIAAVNAAGTSSFATWQNQPPLPYSGPIITGFSNRNLITQEASTVTLTGSRLSLVKELFIGNIKLAFSRNSSDQLVVSIPALTAGIHDLRVVYDPGNLTHLSAFTVRDREPELARQREVRITSFAGNSFALTASARRSIELALNGYVSIAKVICVGSTSATRVTAADRRLATQRAQAACNYVKQLQPAVAVEIRSNPAAGVGPRFRNVTIQVTEN